MERDCILQPSLNDWPMAQSPSRLESRECRKCASGGTRLNLTCRYSDRSTCLQNSQYSKPQQWVDDAVHDRPRNRHGRFLQARLNLDSCQQFVGEGRPCIRYCGKSCSIRERIQDGQLCFCESGVFSCDGYSTVIRTSI